MVVTGWGGEEEDPGEVNTCGLESRSEGHKQGVLTSDRIKCTRRIFKSALGDEETPAKPLVFL